jgi:hypothetical protein
MKKREVWRSSYCTVLSQSPDSVEVPWQVSLQSSTSGLRRTIHGDWPLYHVALDRNRRISRESTSFGVLVFDAIDERTSKESFMV